MSHGAIVGELQLANAPARMRTSATGRYLARLNRQHLGEGMPQLAVFAFDHVGTAISLWGRYERDELALLMRAVLPQLAPGGVCLDVGANIGNHALFFADHFAEVLAFEPNPRTFGLLQFNAAARTNLRCFNLGASDADASARLSVPADNIGMATLHGADAGARGVECTLRRLDGLAELAARRVTLIKIDVEGHEAAVLSGARALLERDRPVVVFEQAEAEIQGSSSAAIELLRAAGYRRFWTIEHYPATGWRIADLLLRLLRGEGLRLVECERFEARFHSMIVALPTAAG